MQFYEVKFLHDDTDLYINDKNNKEIVSGHYDEKTIANGYNYKEYITDWDKIIRTYNDNDVLAYQFNWCIIYSINGSDFTGVSGDKYDNEYNNNADFKRVYILLGLTIINGSAS